MPEVNEDFHQLARRIYRKHKQAIDLILAHKERYEPNYVNEGFRMVRHAAEQQPMWKTGTVNHPYYRFVSRDWSKYEELQIDGWPRALVHFQVHVMRRQAELCLFIASRGNERLARMIFDGLKTKSEVFGDEPPPSYSDDYTNWRIGNVLEESDYEHWWDEEGTHDIVSSRLKEFAENQFPQINKIVIECLEKYRAESN